MARGTGLSCSPAPDLRVRRVPPSLSAREPFLSCEWSTYFLPDQRSPVILPKKNLFRIVPPGSFSFSDARAVSARPLASPIANLSLLPSCVFLGPFHPFSHFSLLLGALSSKPRLSSPQDSFLCKLDPVDFFRRAPCFFLSRLFPMPPILAAVPPGVCLG